MARRLHRYAGRLPAAIHLRMVFTETAMHWAASSETEMNRDVGGPSRHWEHPNR